MEAFIKIYLYRTDLFEDPDIQAAFEDAMDRRQPVVNNAYLGYYAAAEANTLWFHATRLASAEAVLTPDEREHSRRTIYLFNKRNVRLPMLDDQERIRASSRSQSEPHRVSGPSRRVLVVEDNRDVARQLAHFLKVNGHQVQTVYDGTAALQSAATFKPEVVLMDIGLPGLNGHEVGRRMRRDPLLKDLLLIAKAERPDFVVPNRAQPPAGAILPYLRPIDADDSYVGDAVSGESLTVRYYPTWPENPPTLICLAVDKAERGTVGRPAVDECR